ncbi:MAG: hypothetical protein J5545_07070 [Bacteroidaceae bacterium]|nr:hypothetical protein [Bacteroidaceae bacterium]
MNLKNFPMPGIPANTDTTDAATRAALAANPHLQIINDSTFIDWSYIDAAHEPLTTRADEENDDDHTEGHTPQRDPEVTQHTFEFDLTGFAEKIPGLNRVC